MSFEAVMEEKLRLDCHFLLPTICESARGVKGLVLTLFGNFLDTSKLSDLSGLILDRDFLTGLLNTLGTGGGGGDVSSPRGHLA